MVSLANWMSDLGDNTKLNDIIMPGSHDAGMYKVTARKGACTRDDQAITQVGDIEMQLEAGTRFFDFRVYRRKGVKLHLGHFAEFGIGKTMRGRTDHGAYGPELVDALNQVKLFMESYGGRDAVIIRFSHILGARTGDVVRAVKSCLDDYLYNPSIVLSLNDIALRKIRGKVLAVFESNFKKEIQTNTGIIAYGKYDKKKRGIARRKIVLWGEYANKPNVEAMRKDQVKKLEKHKKEEAQNNTPHLRMLYWTLTGVGVNIEKMSLPALATFGPILCNKILPKYKVNIVMYDFVQERFNRMIVNRNPGINV